MKELTKEQALKIYNSGAWKTWSDEQIVRLQLYQDRLCVDFGRFHEAVEKVLGRGVWTHEFAFPQSLRDEYEQKKPAPTFEEIFGLLPPEKTILVIASESSKKKSEQEATD